MPWAISNRPSLSLGILKGICSQEEIESKVIYSNIEFLAYIDNKVATQFAVRRVLSGLSEHLFACSIYGKDALESEQFISNMREYPDVVNAVPKDILFDVRDNQIPSFLTFTVERILDYSPSIIGFSATFNQVMASLAVAKMIKEKNPEIITLFGGACFHDPMGQEYHRACIEFIDHVFLGEADDSFRKFIQCWHRGETLDNIPGVTYQDVNKVAYLLPEPVTDLNQLPVPDYDDYYLDLDRLTNESSLEIEVESLPYESSRGCWWGRKSHCIFCGLTKDDLSFRCRGPVQVLEDILTLSEKYQELNLSSTDLIISWPNLSPVLQKISELGLDLNLFYEVKASLKKEQVELLKNAGVNLIQPGIESLSTDALKLMAKGTSLLINLQCLKWAKEYDIKLAYSFLIGFPKENSEWYNQAADLVPLFHHLQPPMNPSSLVEIHRYSPLFERREDFGVGTLVPRRDYLNCFPAGSIDLGICSYYFEEEGIERPTVFSATGEEDQAELPGYINHFRRAINAWIQLHQSVKSPPTLQLCRGTGFAKIIDRRSKPGREYVVSHQHLDVLLLCDRIQVRSSILRLLGKKYRQCEVNEAIEDFLDCGVLIQEGKKILSLAVCSQPCSTEHLESGVTNYEKIKLPNCAQSYSATSSM